MKPAARHSRAGAFTLSNLLVVLGTVLLLGLLIAPYFAVCKAKSPRITCVNQLKQITMAFQIWGRDHDDRYPMEVLTNTPAAFALVNPAGPWRYFQAVSNELGSPKILRCPVDNGRKPAENNGRSFGDQTISYFAVLSANEINPNLMLAGDRHLRGDKLPVQGQLWIGTNEHIRFTGLSHAGAGNVAITDGSVQQLSSGTPSDHFGGTNWLLFP